MKRQIRPFLFIAVFSLSLFRTLRAQLPGGKPPAESTQSHGYLVRTVPVSGSPYSADEMLVLTRDEVYVPIIIRKPQGNGPFPAITMGSGEGRGGLPHIEELMRRLAPMQDRMIQRGYAVVTVNYRNEIPYEYEKAKPPQNLPDSISGERRMLKSGPTLDHEDLIAIVKYLQTLPYIDKNGIGSMGVSHSGEMIMKASSEYSWGAGVAIEPSRSRVSNRGYRAECTSQGNGDPVQRRKRRTCSRKQSGRHGAHSADQYAHSRLRPQYRPSERHFPAHL